MSTESALLGVVDVEMIPHVVLGLYMIMLLGIGVAGYLKSKASEEDYFLAGRRQGAIVTTLTIMATFFSSGAMLGVPGLVYKEGMAFVFFALNLPLAGAAIYILGSRIWKLGKARGYVTQADLLTDYYGGSSLLRVLVALVGFLYVLPYIIMQIKAGGYLAQRMFPDAKAIELLGVQFDAFRAGAAALSLLTMLYVLVGGMRTVAWTDVIQGSLLLAGMIIAGVATVVAMNGPKAFMRQLTELPHEALSIPGPSGIWSPWKLMTLCIFASLASMIQPGQWMRYYAASSTVILKKSALVFALVLPPCFLFGVMLVGLGARALYPPAVIEGDLTPHEMIGSRTNEFDQVVVAMVQEQVPALMGPALGAVVVSIILVAIIAASMSTADSNLHALSAVMTRDIFGRFIRPKASEKERAWFGRGIIVVTTGLALWLVDLDKTNPDLKPLAMIAQLMFVAMAFSCQLLPVTLDILFIRKGTSAGAIAGISSGILAVFFFTPFPGMLMGQSAGAAVTAITGPMEALFDIGFCGLMVNVAVFVIVSRLTTPPPPDHVKTFENDLKDKSRRP